MQHNKYMHMLSVLMKRKSKMGSLTKFHAFFHGNSKIPKQNLICCHWTRCAYEFRYVLLVTLQHALLFDTYHMGSEFWRLILLAVCVMFMSPLSVSASWSCAEGVILIQEGRVRIVFEAGSDEKKTIATKIAYYLHAADWEYPEIM